MGRLRWATDEDGRWELDMESPATMEGTARPVPGDPLPLGLSRGTRVTRPKQLDFFHRFMSTPLVPSFAAACGGLSFHHAHLVHLTHRWSVTLLEQLHAKELKSFVEERILNCQKGTSWSENIGQRLHDIVSLGFGTELLVTPNSTLLLELYNIKKGNRGKAVFQHKFPQQNLTLEAAWPGLFLDEKGKYWDVPLSLALDLASVGSSSGISYHLCLQHKEGQPKSFSIDENSDVPMSLLPGFCARAALSLKKSVDIWRKKENKLKSVQPYDALLFDPAVSLSGVVGVVTSASVGDCSARLSTQDEIQRSNALKVFNQTNKFALFADLFGSVTSTAQHGNFQRLFFDLTRVSARMDVLSGALFLTGASKLAQDFFYSRRPDIETYKAVIPDVTVSLQQQIVGPFSFRVDSRIIIDPVARSNVVRIEDPVFAVHWALKVLGSAKATAWYSLQRREGMVELRFFEK